MRSTRTGSGRAVEEWDSRGMRLPLTGLYAGAAGVVLALDQLRRRGYVETRLDLADVARRAAGVEPLMELPLCIQAGGCF